MIESWRGKQVNLKTNSSLFASKNALSKKCTHYTLKIEVLKCCKNGKQPTFQFKLPRPQLLTKPPSPLEKLALFPTQPRKQLVTHIYWLFSSSPPFKFNFENLN